MPREYRQIDPNAVIHCFLSTFGAYKGKGCSWLCVREYHKNLITKKVAEPLSTSNYKFNTFREGITLRCLISGNHSITLTSITLLNSLHRVLEENSTT